MGDNQIGFHLEDVNPLLIEFWQKTNPSYDKSVFVPLCGKSEDLIWLATKHEEVQGIRIKPDRGSRIFSEHLYTPTVTQISGQHELYQFDELSVYTGDYFNFNNSACRHYL